MLCAYTKNKNDDRVMQKLGTEKLKKRKGMAESGLLDLDCIAEARRISGTVGNVGERPKAVIPFAVELIRRKGRRAAVQVKQPRFLSLNLAYPTAYFSQMWTR